MFRWIVAKIRKLAEEPPPRTLRLFLVRTGEYEYGGPNASSNWRLTTVGQEQAAQAAATIRQRLGETSPTVLLHVEADLSYRQTIVVIAQKLGVPTKPIVGMSYVPEDYDLEQFADLGKALVMVMNGTSLTDVLYRYGGSLDNLTILGPPHGSVHELVIKYQPATPLSPCKSISRQFV
jgi:hypothetical protein